MCIYIHWCCHIGYSRGLYHKRSFGVVPRPAKKVVRNSRNFVASSALKINPQVFQHDSISIMDFTEKSRTLFYIAILDSTTTTKWIFRLQYLLYYNHRLATPHVPDWKCGTMPSPMFFFRKLHQGSLFGGRPPEKIKKKTTKKQPFENNIFVICGLRMNAFHQFLLFIW